MQKKLRLRHPGGGAYACRRAECKGMNEAALISCAAPPMAGSHVSVVDFRHAGTLKLNLTYSYIVLEFDDV